MKDPNTHKNLISLLKIFKNRPYHLSKYLLEHGALTKDFLDKISKSDKLTNFSEENYINEYFSNISQMEDFYNSLLEEINDGSLIQDREKFTKDLNKKLNSLIIEEKYEEAAALRDFMIIHGIKKK